MKKKILYIVIILASLVSMTIWYKSLETEYEVDLTMYDFNYDEDGIMIEPSFEPSIIQNANTKIKETEEEFIELLDFLIGEGPFTSSRSLIEGNKIVTMGLSQLYYYPDDYNEGYYSYWEPDKDINRDPIRENPLTGEDTGDVHKFTIFGPEQWCTDFVSWCYNYAGCPMKGGGATVPGIECSSTDWMVKGGAYSVRYFRKYKSWYYPEELPQQVQPVPGDFIYLPEHVAFVWEVVNNDLHILEGNYGDKVNDRWIRDYRNNKLMKGYGLRFGCQRIVSHGDRVDTVASIDTQVNGVLQSDIEKIIDGDLATVCELNFDDSNSVSFQVDLKEPYIIRRVAFSWGEEQARRVRLAFSNTDSFNDFDETTDWFEIEEDELYTSMYILPYEYRYITIEIEGQGDIIDLKEVLILD
ncbi:CHAP domain-containing protein [Vallitalea okinawensis]|uniref:CHAP domain-containing protein n=1 Tax=Vallitalea okinawensis TaxID=2078660 RepID=UPI000CFD8D9B|nr:CHAP domain-containing protein [Vallitalea okinawensis]